MSNPYYSTGHVILNIGLIRADNKLPLNPLFVEQYLNHLGLEVRDFKIFQSDSEPTAVVVIRQDKSNPLCTQDLREIAEFLYQDAIAWYYPAHSRGELFGPKAEAWGPFNPQYFLMPDGRRLSEHNL
jgi:hypothetical protein